MIIKILGAGCKSCVTLAENAERAAKEMGLDAQVEKVTDLEAIVSYGILRTPALVVDEKVMSFGRVLSPAEITKLLQKAGCS
jgi:small redox-active disulfide protein 2